MSGAKEINVKLLGGSEFEEVLFTEEKEILVMGSLRAPLFEQNAEDKRAPIDICCVIDRSGSMAGAKLEMVKQAMHFVLKNLDGGDGLSIVVYDTNVKTLFDFTKMDKDGKAKAAEEINNITSGDMTNLSGGLLQGMDLAANRKNPNAISSVLLFTDGLANEGITDAAKITAAMQAKQQQAAASASASASASANQENNQQSGANATTVFTFGFGADHSESLLRAISEVGSGLNYYVADVDKIPTSFADCLGGLQSVVAQNLSVSVETTNGVIIQKSLNTKYRTALDQSTLPGTHTTLEMNDLYSEEERDLIFLVKLPILPAEDVTEQATVKFRLRYFNVLSTQSVEVEAIATIRRPGVISESAAKPNKVLDQQRNRIAVADAMEAAKNSADSGDFTLARDAISKAKEFVGFSHSSNEVFCQKLVKELDECTSDLANKEYYKNEGSKKMSRKGQSHQNQRSNRIVDTECDFYETTTKAYYKAKSKEDN